MEISIWKGVQYYYSLGKCKLKPQQDTNTHLLGWFLFFFKLVIPSADEESEEQELSQHGAGKA